MCGIAGLFAIPDSLPSGRCTSSVLAMSDAMVRRGPDDSGLWCKAQDGIYMSFRRLSVLDTSPAGHQPMVTDDGMHAIVFNGEIYNHSDLRAELSALAHVFTSRSDTEVLLAAMREWGTNALQRLNGMFAFAWYDGHAKRLTLARDHAGIKPLYCFLHPDGKAMAFASRYDAIHHCPWPAGDVREDVMHLFVRLHHIPPPFAMHRNAIQLEPGAILTVERDGTMRMRKWWAIDEEESVRHCPRADVMDRVDAALAAATERQLEADVPVGVFLSGGVDSPLVASYATAHRSGKLDAFTISTAGWWQDEGPDAQRYAAALGVRHHICESATNDIRALVEDAFTAQYEPFGDFSILPTLLISSFARSQVTVALSGDGGDELFFGYERPLSLLRDGGLFRYPRHVRAALYLAGKYGVLKRRSGSVLARTPGDYYYNVNCRMSFADARAMIPGAMNAPQDFTIYDDRGVRDYDGLARFSRRAEYFGQLQRGLKKVDMASMHHSLEVRVPMLDRDVLAASMLLAPADAMKDGRRKSVLYDLLGRHVDPAIIPRQKRGFAVPLGEWFRGSLRELLEDVIVRPSSQFPSFIQPDAVRGYFRQHLDGGSDHKWGIWTLLSLLEWCRRNPAQAA